MGLWTGEDARIGSARLALTDRAGRWVTQQVGRHGRTVNEVASELDCDWHTVNNAVLAYGEALLDADTERIGQVTVLGMDETLFARMGRWRHQQWVNFHRRCRAGVLLDVVPGRGGTEPAAWLSEREPEWLAGIQWATLDLSSPYRAVFDTMLPDAVQVADPFHVVKLANHKLDECRRRVHNVMSSSTAGASRPVPRWWEQ